LFVGEDRIEMSSTSGVIAGVCCALVIACAASHKSMSSAPPPVAETAGAAPALPQTPHAQIEQLDRDITDARTKLGLPEAPAVAACTGPGCPTPMVAAADPSCHPGTSDTCSNTCTLADSICGNAEKICELAKQMQGDTWAADHCTSATTTCQAAHTRCCGCQ
jgi:hypothetical protein